MYKYGFARSTIIRVAYCYTSGYDVCHYHDGSNAETVYGQQCEDDRV